MDNVSLIIPTYNNEATLRACLESIKKQTLTPIEIIISDGHSTDQTLSIARAFGCKIVFEEGGTRAAACNIALKSAEGELIAFTDSDVIAKEDWLEKLVSTFEVMGDNDIVCITGPNIEYPNESLFGKAVTAVYNTFLGGAWSEQVRSIFNKEGRFVDSAAGCNAIYKREALDEVLPFNETLLTAEDTDINYKLLKQGYKLFFNPEAIVYHQRPQSHKALRSKSKKYAIGKVQFFREHKTGLELWHLLPSFYFITGLFLVLGLCVNFWFWVAIVSYFGLYLFVILLASIIQTIRFKQWKFLFLLPLMFIEGHISWSNGIFKEIFLPMNRE